MLAPLTGAKVYVMRQYTMEKYMLYNDIYRITRMTSVPTIMVMRVAGGGCARVILGIAMRKAAGISWIV